MDEWEEMAEDSGVGIVAVRSYLRESSFEVKIKEMFGLEEFRASTRV